MKRLSFYLSFLLLFGFSILCWLIILGDLDNPVMFTQPIAWILQTLQGKLLIVSCGLISMGCAFSILMHSFVMDEANASITIQHNDSGFIGISQEAVEQFITIFARQYPSVEDLSIRTEEDDGDVRVRVKLVLNLRVNIPDFIQSFQDCLWDELRETLGLQTIREIEVMIHKVIPRDKTTAPFAKEKKHTVVLKNTV
jgi:uncharacterized alkaline shock family protein YloU